MQRMHDPNVEAVRQPNEDFVRALQDGYRRFTTVGFALAPIGCSMVLANVAATASPNYFQVSSNCFFLQVTANCLVAFFDLWWIGVCAVCSALFGCSMVLANVAATASPSYFQVRIATCRLMEDV
mgnify:CR=1 FL=1